MHRLGVALKRLLAILVVAVSVSALCIALVGCSSLQEQSSQQESNTAQAQQGSGDQQDSDAQAQKEKKVDYTTGVHRLKVVLSGFEDRPLTIEVYSDSAKKSVRKIASLIDSGYYLDKPIFEIMKDMYVKVGNPTQDNTNLITGEYEDSGVSNSNSLRRGTIALSRAEDGQQSDASSFIICLSDLSYLDGKYAGFGKVTEGMDVIDEIVEHLDAADENWHIRTDEQGKVLNEDMPKISSIEWID